MLAAQEPLAQWPMPSQDPPSLHCDHLMSTKSWVSEEGFVEAGWKLETKGQLALQNA